MEKYFVMLVSYETFDERVDRLVIINIYINSERF